jgi:hypothetical protein
VLILRLDEKEFELKVAFLLLKLKGWKILSSDKQKQYLQLTSANIWNEGKMPFINGTIMKQKAMLHYWDNFFYSICFSKWNWQTS